ncbi:MAG: helix-turn-helix domain-containing protein [Pseudomonadota bacterium]
MSLGIINEKEAAKIIGKSVFTLRNDRFMSRGLPFIKIGRSVRYRLKDIESFIDSHRIDPEKSLSA